MTDLLKELNISYCEAEGALHRAARAYLSVDDLDAHNTFTDLAEFIAEKFDAAIAAEDTRLARRALADTDSERG